MPADPILIYDEEGRERITFVGPYTENQDTKITCKAYGGTALFQGFTEAQFVSWAYGAVVQFGLGAYGGTRTCSLFGPTKVQFGYKGLRRYS